ncbi:MAG: LamG domain-containing protein [Acidobacteria bacterium]|nr:LamG domain-containing protein [Acidobacteriota bacterium]
MDDRTSFGDIAALDSVAALTAMIWLSVDTYGGVDSYPLVKGNTDNTDNFLVGINSAGQVVVTVGDGTAGRPKGTWTGPIGTTTWKHLTIVFNGGGAANADRLKLYIDGANQALSFSGTIPATTQASAHQLRVGGRGTDVTASSCLNGQAAFLRAWSAALSATEIETERWSTLAARTSNLVIDAEEEIDYSGNGHTGTVSGALVAAGPPVARLAGSILV